MSIPRKRALACSGGGIKGAFAVGALLELREAGATEFEIVAGTSTGALIAPMAFIGEWDVIAKAYASASTADIYKKLSEAELFSQITTAILKGKAWIPSYMGTMEPLRARIEAYLTEEHWRHMLAEAREKRRELYLTTVDFQSGRLVYWSLPGPMFKGGLVPRIIDSRKRLVDVMVASSTIPISAPPVDFPDAGGPHQYVDGGVREVFPAQVCLEQGATSLDGVVMQPGPEGLSKEVRFAGGKATLVNVQPKRYTTGEDVLSRVVDLLGAESREDEVRLVELTRQSVRFRSRLREALVQRVGEASAVALLTGLEKDDPFARYGLERLRIVRPEGLLSGRTLDATPEQMKNLIAYGRDRAKKAIADGA